MYAIIVAITSTSICVIMGLLSFRSYLKEMKTRTEGHSNHYIRGNGWMLIDGEFVEVNR